MSSSSIASMSQTETPIRWPASFSESPARSRSSRKRLAIDMVISGITLAVSSAGIRAQKCKQGRSTGAHSTALVRPHRHFDFSLLSPVCLLQLSNQLVNLHLLVLDLESLRQIQDVVEGQTLLVECPLNLLAYPQVENGIQTSPKQYRGILSHCNNLHIVREIVSGSPESRVDLRDAKRLEHCLDDPGPKIVQAVVDLAGDK